MRRLLVLALTGLMLLSLMAIPAVADGTTEVITIRAFAEVDPSNDYTQNYALDYIEKATGVRIDCNGLVFNSQEAPQQKQLLLNSGDYPELFLTQDAACFTYNEMLIYGTKEKILQPLEELLKLSPEMMKIYALRPEYAKMHTAPDGHQYGVPRVSECGHCEVGAKLYLNMDWMNKLGLTVPTTLDEFREVLVKFRDGDPNGNGTKDEIAFTATPNVIPQLILNNFISTEVVRGKFIRIVNDKVEFVATAPEFKEAIAYMKSMYQDQLIDAASFTQDGNGMRAAVCNDPTLVGAFAGHIYQIDMQNEYVFQNYRAIETLKGPNGVQYAPRYPFANMNLNGYFMITDKCQNPEAAIKWLDFAMVPETSIIRYYGKEGVGWKHPDTPQKNILGGDYLWQFLPAPEDASLAANTTFSAGPILGLVEHRASWSPAAPDEALFTDPTIFEARIETETERYARPFFDATMPDNFYLPTGEEVSEYAELHTNITEYVRSSIAQFTTGDRDLDAEWDAYVAQLDALNVTRFVELMQVGYDSTMKQ